jgi:nitrogen fixation-related uncharacterized protein
MTTNASAPWVRVAGILWCLLLAAASLKLAGPPPPRPASAPATEFSAERAMRHVREIARAPHPVGCAEHNRVRDYLVQQLSDLGLEPSVQKTIGVMEQYHTAGEVENILARKRGLVARPAVLLAAHYDSVPPGPGAGDDGAGVAALLETARALAAGPPLRNDVIFLITDGEELGLLGARAFVEEHPWKKDAGVVLNFDNRGSRGAAVMYQTSPENGWLVRQLAQAAPAPRASSLSAAVADRMPNSSDFVVFREAGIAGLNFAFIGGPENYHTPQDSPENLDPRTLQHEGSCALSLARRLADADLARIREPDAVFFNPVGNWELVYPAAWTRPLGIAALVLFLAVMLLGLLRGVLSVGGSLLSLALCAVSLLAAWLASDGLAVSLVQIHGHSIPAGPFFFSATYAAALYCLVAGIVFASWEILAHAPRWENISLAGAGVWTALAVLSAIQFPAVSFVVLWPLFPVLVALGIVFAVRSERMSWQVALLWIAAVPGVLLFAPLFPLLRLALGMSTLGASAQGVVGALLLWLLAPVLAGYATKRRLHLSLAFLAAGVLMFLWGLLTVRYDDHHPRPESIAYVLDADRRSAQWFSPTDSGSTLPGAGVDPWRAQYLSTAPGTSTFPIVLPGRRSLPSWSHEAPLIELAPPGVDVLENKTENEVRVLRLCLRTPRPAARLWFEVRARRILSVFLNGRVMKDSRPGSAMAGARVVSKGASGVKEETWSLLFAAPPSRGLELTFALPAGTPLELKVADLSDGLPQIPGRSFAPRPPEVTQQHFADATIVVRNFRF